MRGPFDPPIQVTINIFHNTVRQLEQQIKSILDSIAVSEERKKELIRGDAVDKAEQLSEFLWCLHMCNTITVGGFAITLWISQKTC